MGQRLDVARAAPWWAQPRWSCSPAFIFLGTAATGALLIAWIPIAPFVDHLWNHGPRGTYNDLPDVHPLTILAAATTTVICAPILEELLFRGGLQSWLGRRLPRGAAVVVATLAFTWVHGLGPGAYNSVQLLDVAISGFLYAGLYQATKSVTPGIVAHMARNGCIVVSVATRAPILVPAALAVLLGLIGLAWSWRRTSAGAEFGRVD